MGIRKTAKSEHQHSEQFMLRQQLKAEPHHHWILTRLSSVYYEQRRYALALKYAEKAFAEYPLALLCSGITQGLSRCWVATTRHLTSMRVSLLAASIASQTGNAAKEEHGPED